MELDHVNIATPDASGLAEIFSDLFGLQIVKRTEVADQGVRVVKLAAGNAIIEMTEPTGEDTPVGRFLAKNRPGLHHVCFRVDDLRATVRDLLAEGVELVNEEPSIGAAGLPIVFVHPRSCGGVLVELQETPRT